MGQLRATFKGHRYLAALALIGAAACAPQAPQIPISDSANRSAGKSDVAKNGETGELQSALGESSLSATKSFGAKVGDPDEREAAKKCIEGGHYFDRDIQKCDRTVKIAKVDCTKSGIEAASVISKKDREVLKERIYDEGYLVDQCINYSRDKFQVWFVKEEGDELKRISAKFVVKS